MEEKMTDEPQFPQAELARLADGSLPASRQSELRAEVDGSPELAAALAEQQHAVSLLHALDDPAPESLRARVQELTGPARTSRPARRRRPFLLPAATVLAVAVAALVVVLQGGGTTPTVPQTVHFALAASTMPSPSEDASHRDLLSLKVDGIPFPYYERTVGWNTAGSRTDTLGGRRVVTVFYTAARGGTRVGYAIVSGAPLPATAGNTVDLNGTRFTMAQVGSAHLITFLRSGHSCVIAGRQVGYPTLLKLATDDATTPAAS
jgi:hypothetical protein